MLRELRPTLWVLSLVLFGACSRENSNTRNQAEWETAVPEYIGRTACVSCHASQVDAWTGSHHDLAMQEVSESTVLGDFDTSTFSYHGVLTTFFRRDGDFYVNTDGPDGELQDYKVAYVFGVVPLQQYLIAFPGGRLQSLGIAWDTRDAGEGGQRWFHLYPDNIISADSPLHWTGPNQNWNYMCADCHSTNLQKNYDLESNRYRTEWSEIDVSCEACHGPASNHVEWAEWNNASGGKNDSSRVRVPAYLANGLVVKLPKAGAGSLVMNSETGIARLEGRTESNVLLNTCAPCHVRRSRITQEFHPGQPLMSSHRPSLLREGLYFPDGQIRDEVYVYGSFVQSKMYAAGVTCSDCHNSHSLELLADGNALCATCHAPDKFDTENHMIHEVGTEAAQCITCHMPQRTYMVVDPRRDHSFSVPRPDLARKTGAPDACTSCHNDKSAEWASEKIAEHYGIERRASMHFGEAFALAYQQEPGAEDLLIRVAEEPTNPAIARGSALSMMGEFLSPLSSATVSRALLNQDPLVRFGAVVAAEYFSDQDRLSLVFPLLSDSILAVRIEAARVLASVPPEITSPDQRQAIVSGAEEYMTAERVQEDRPEAWMNIALVQSRLGRFSDAENSYRRALNLNPRESAAYVNLSDLYRVRALEPESEQILLDGLGRIPDDPGISHALGLSLVRQQRIGEALPFLESAANNAPETPRFIYVFAIATNSTGETSGALDALTKGVTLHPNNLDILMALTTINRDVGNYETALRYGLRLQGLIPRDPNVGSLVTELRAAVR